MQDEIRMNRKHKDRLFRKIFQKKEDLLSLYNALNNSDYTDAQALCSNTKVHTIPTCR